MKQMRALPAVPAPQRFEGAVTITVVTSVDNNGVVNETKFLNSDIVELQQAIATKAQQAVKELSSKGMLNFRIPAGFTAEQVAKGIGNLLKSAGASLGTIRSEKNAGKQFLVSSEGTFIKFFVTSADKEARKAENADILRSLING